MTYHAERELARLREFLKFIALGNARSGDAAPAEPACEPFNVQGLAIAALNGLVLEQAKERCRSQGL